MKTKKENNMVKITKRKKTTNENNSPKNLTAARNLERISKAIEKAEEHIRNAIEADIIWMIKSIKMKDQIGEEILGTAVNQMDDILKKNDKFETIKVIMTILCKELGIEDSTQPGAIGQAVKKVYEDYYKAMEEFKKIKKNIQQ